MAKSGFLLVCSCKANETDLKVGEGGGGQNIGIVMGLEMGTDMAQEKS